MGETGACMVHLTGRKRREGKKIVAILNGLETTLEGTTESDLDKEIDKVCGLLAEYAEERGLEHLLSILDKKGIRYTLVPEFEQTGQESFSRSELVPAGK